MATNNTPRAGDATAQTAAVQGQTDIHPPSPVESSPEKNSEDATATASSSTIESSTEITRLYLTFQTRLPSPATNHDSNDAVAAAGSSSSKIPECPNLNPYINPVEWSPARKSVLLVLSCIATFLTSYTAGAYSPPTSIMADEFHTTRLVVLVGITMFCIGFGFAPMALAPLSETWGRLPIFIIAGIGFVVFQAVCSVMPHIAGMLIARMLVGAGGSVFSAVVGGVIADLWDKEERNTPMALFSGSVLLGTGAGPLVSAALLEVVDDMKRKWQWTFWHQAIMDAVLVAFLVIWFKESRASVLLTRKAKVLNAWYEDLERAGVHGVWVPMNQMTPVAAPDAPRVSGSSSGSEHPGYGHTAATAPELRRIRWVVKADEQRPSVGTIILTSLKRPFLLLFTEPVVFCFSLWAAFSWGVLYLSFAVVPFLYAGDLDMSSRVYIAMMAAAAVATVAGILQEQLLRYPSWKSEVYGGCPTTSKFWLLMRRKFPAEAPESRLYFACVTAMLLPAGLFGAFLVPIEWKGHAQAIGIGFATWGIYSVYLATFNYLADTYHIYASSALAAQSLCRNLLGGVFPLLATPMFSNLGLKSAGGILGAIATVLTLIPWVLVFFGERIRSRSKIAIVS